MIIIIIIIIIIIMIIIIIIIIIIITFFTNRWKLNRTKQLSVPEINNISAKYTQPLRW